MKVMGAFSNGRGLALAEAARAATMESLRSPGSCDAIVIGTGAAGGMAAVALTEAGLNVLALDAGAPATSLRVWSKRAMRRAGRLVLGPARMEALIRRRQPVQAHCYAWSSTPDAFVDDLDHPYTTSDGRPFLWFRSRQLGGRMVVPGHGRQYYRMGPDDLAPGDGASPRWPVSYEELEPWYALAEKRLRLAGMREGLPWLPDSELQSVLEPLPYEVAARAAVARKWPHYQMVLGRYSTPFDLLEEAARTGRLRVRQGAVAREIEVDASGRARGVVWTDWRTRATERVAAPLIFLCTSTLESTRLLLLSRPPRSPEGVGAASGVLGRYLMDHLRIRMEGRGRPLSDASSEGGRCLYLPRFDARALPAPAPGRGFGVQLYHAALDRDRSRIRAASFGEMLPRWENRVVLHPTQRDRWGVPTLHIDCAHGPAEMDMARAQTAALTELAEALEVNVTHLDTAPPPPGSANHECGTARMGEDPADSVLDPHNECWEARGLYVTDGACMPSQGSQNPTLTYLALTARACDHAVRTARGC